MPEIVFTEWRDNNENVKYPFSDSASLTNSQNIILDRDLFDDARVYPLGSVVGLHLSKLTVGSSDIIFSISDDETKDIASGTFISGSLVDDITLVDKFNRPAGILVSSSTRLEGIFGKYSKGEIVFTRDQTEFAPSVSIPMPQIGVEGFVLDDGTLLTGDVILIGTDGVVLSLDDDGNIRVDVVGDPNAVAKECDKNGIPVPGFCGLKTINGISPDAKGDFKIFPGTGEITGGAVDNILRIEQGQNGIIKIKAVGTLNSK
jgi:hypothetical protein